jgi:acyl carrier protein
MPVDSAHLSHDATAVAFIVELMASTQDVYLRALPGEPTMQTSLRDELALDSIGLVSVFYAVIDHFGVELDEAEVAGWRTLGDVVSLARKCAA